MKRVIFYFLLIIVSTGLSCSKGGESSNNDDGPHVVSPNDVTAPVLIISTPTTNEVFATGNTINITGRITDDLGLYRGTIRVTNDANSELLKQQVYEIHGVLSYNYNVSYTPSVIVASNYTVTVTFEDHGTNVTTQTVKIKVNP